MVVYYLDTSAIVKRYRTDEGPEVIYKLLGDPLSDDRFCTSFLSVLELTSSVVRLVRSGQLKDKTATEIVARFRLDLHERFRVWPLDDDIASEAVTVVEKHGLRSADAIHLATATSIFSAISGAEPVMVSSDSELLQASRASGITALDPKDASAPDLLLKLRAGGH